MIQIQTTRGLVELTTVTKLGFDLWQVTTTTTTQTFWSEQAALVRFYNLTREML